MPDHKLFDEKTRSFYRRLELNNDKEWFEAHRKEYNQTVLDPAREFVVRMGQKLADLRPDLVYAPKIDQSIFRIFRDIRFSKDKSPYKTFLGILWWEGANKKMECPSFYFQLDCSRIFLGCGLYQFSKKQLEKYRQVLTDDSSGKELIQAINQSDANGEFEIGGKYYKNVPRGFDKDHLYADYLKHNGLYFSYTSEFPKEFGTEAFVEWCLRQYKEMLPLHNWLVKVFGEED